MASSKVKDHELIAKAKTFDNVPLCEEYEKMISGMLYDPFGPILSASRLRARRLALEYSNYVVDKDATPETVAVVREAQYHELFGKTGKNVYIEPPIRVDYGFNISIGDDVYINFNTTILDSSLVTIGNRVLFGPNVSLLAASHETDVQSRREGVEYAKFIDIGDDCWIGGGVTILPGIKIGKGSTIGACSLVTKDIPDFSVAIGTPAVVIKTVKRVPDIS